MNIYAFTAQTAQGIPQPLADYRGKVLLIVNTASRCGLTGQYADLQTLYERYREQGFEILDFPCNQFREQAPESSTEYAQVCQLKFGTRFTIFDKIQVNGPDPIRCMPISNSSSPLIKAVRKSKPCCSNWLPLAKRASRATFNGISPNSSSVAKAKSLPATPPPLSRSSWKTTFRPCWHKQPESDGGFGEFDRF